MRPAKTQISLGIRLVWSESSQCAPWVAKDPMFLHADSEDSDQTGQMPRLIWVFAGRTCHFVGFVMRRLKIWKSLCENGTFIPCTCTVLPADLGSITLKCNALHYNYFQNYCIILQLRSFWECNELHYNYFTKVMNYITITFWCFFIKVLRNIRTCIQYIKCASYDNIAAIMYLWPILVVGRSYNALPNYIMLQNKNSDGRQNSYQNCFYLSQETNISGEMKCFSSVFFFPRTKSLSTIYCLEMHMFSVWYVPMHLCGVVLVCGSLVTENVWNEIFTIKSTMAESYYNTCTFKYLYSTEEEPAEEYVTAKHFCWGHSIFHFYILFQRFCQPVSKFLGEIFCQQC